MNDEKKPVAYPRLDLTAMVSEMLGVTPAAKDNSTITYKSLRDELMSDPSVSFWLRKAIASLEARDPVDALHDVQVLMELANLRVK